MIFHIFSDSSDAVLAQESIAEDSQGFKFEVSVKIEEKRLILGVL